MKNTFKDSRLLEAFGYIDSRFIAEVADDLKIEPEYTPEHGKKATRRSIRYALAIAACAVLLGALIPVMNYVVRNFPSIVSGIFGSDTEQTEQTEQSLNDFVYETEIDTEHVITDAELAAMNRLWISEFGKKLAETPEEAMKRVENGNFYFGRYGRTFVFYRKRFNMEKTFSFRGNSFAMHWGEFYFINGEKVYISTEIVAASVMTDEHFKALHDCYLNTYLNYKATVTLRAGEHVLTEEELDSMNLAYARKIDAKDTYKLYETLEIAMRREKDRAYYFGKFGDTVIIWSTQHYNEKKSFTLGGCDFEFYSGGVRFFDPTGVYSPEDEGIESIMTEDEIKAFYDHYVRYYIPLNTDPYIILEFTEEIEHLTEAEMRRINAAYYEWKYEQIYTVYYERYIESKYSDQKAHDSAVSAVHSSIGYDPHRFFNEDKQGTYRYYGKRGGNIFLADGYVYSSLHVFEIAGYKFVIDGGAEEIIVICKDGEIRELSEAYEGGFVTKEDVAFAHERHLAYCKYSEGGMEEIAPPARLKIGSYAESPIALSEELQREIVWEYIAGAEESELESTYGVRCYGKFGEAYAVMVDGSIFMYTQAMRTELVAGYTFTFSDGQQMYIYKEGVFYSLLKAYELGIISEENVVSIVWNKTLPYTCETVTAPIQMDEYTVSYALSTYARENDIHKKGGTYSMRCYAEVKYGYAVFVDCSDKTYPNNRTVETIAGYEFIYPTEQTLMICFNWGEIVPLAEAFETGLLTEDGLKTIHEAYRAAFPELYK